MLKRSVILLIMLIAFAVVFIRVVSAAGAVASLTLSDVVLSGCNSNTFEGSYRLTAKDASGAVVNAATSVDATAIFEANGQTYQQAAGHTSGAAVTFHIAFDNTLTSGMFYVQSGSITSETYLLNCSTLTTDKIGGDAGGSGGDDRLNPNNGDLLNVLYSRTDRAGKPEIRVYRLDANSNGVLAGAFAYQDYAAYLGKAPARNVRLATVGKSTLYALTSGEFQINIGPDSEWKVYSIILDTIPPTKVKYSSFKVK